MMSQMYLPNNTYKVRLVSPLEALLEFYLITTASPKLAFSPFKPCHLNDVSDVVYIKGRRWLCSTCACHDLRSGQASASATTSTSRLAEGCFIYVKRKAISSNYLLTVRS